MQSSWQTISRYVVVGLVGLAIGFFGGREHMKYQIESFILSTALNLPTSFPSQSNIQTQKSASNSKIEAENFKNQQKQEYIKKIFVYDFSSSYMNSAYEGRMPGVTFKLKNTGDRTLERVKVTVYFKNADRNIICEQDYVPVHSGLYGTTTPLRPGYIWQIEKGKFYTATNVPSEWIEGYATAEITDIDFAD